MSCSAAVKAQVLTPHPPRVQLYLGNSGVACQDGFPTFHCRVNPELKQTCFQKACFQKRNDPEAQEPLNWCPLSISTIIPFKSSSVPWGACLAQSDEHTTLHLGFLGFFYILFIY